MKQNLLFDFVLMSANVFAQNLTLSDSIALTINEQNTISVKTVFNDKDTILQCVAPGKQSIVHLVFKKIPVTIIGATACLST